MIHSLLTILTRPQKTLFAESSVFLLSQNIFYQASGGRQ